MRVITGSARGKRLGELEGQETRPTTDRVKESVFSMLQFDIAGRQVLDLFAGTGQLGIECLSRDAAGALFVDQRTDAVELIRKNLKLTGLTDRAQVLQGDSLALLGKLDRRFDLIFLDPPYQAGLLEPAIQKIVRFDILKPHGIIIAEHPAAQTLPQVQAPYRLYRTCRYGKIGVTMYHRAVNQENGGLQR